MHVTIVVIFNIHLLFIGKFKFKIQNLSDTDCHIQSKADILIFYLC
jgi:hypothetical protein